MGHAVGPKLDGLTGRGLTVPEPDPGTSAFVVKGLSTPWRYRHIRVSKFAGFYKEEALR
jgi:hypothetical protein